MDLGLLIHEGQLTYAADGLTLVQDMGEWWFGETGLPLPLGGNVVRKDLGEALIKKISRHLRASIAFALDHREDALDHAMKYARGLDRSKADTFVAMMHAQGQVMPDEDVLEDAVAFAGVAKYPARVKCALLGWMAWKDAVLQARANTPEEKL